LRGYRAAARVSGEGSQLGGIPGDVPAQRVSGHSPAPRPLVGWLDQTLDCFIVPMPYSTLAILRGIVRLPVHISLPVFWIKARHANFVGPTPVMNDFPA